MALKAPVDHPHVERKTGFRGGTPILRGTNFPVSAVVVYVLRHGMTPEELVQTFSHLTLAQVYDALSYYYDHREEMEPLVAERVGEDDVGRRLGAEEPFLLRCNPKEDASEVERLFGRPPITAEG